MLMKFTPDLQRHSIIDTGHNLTFQVGNVLQWKCIGFVVDSKRLRQIRRCSSQRFVDDRLEDGVRLPFGRDGGEAARASVGLDRRQWGEEES